MQPNGESYYYYFNPYNYCAVGAGEGWVTVENYQYYFVDYKCMKGKIVKTSSGYKYRFAGLWQRNQWVEYEGSWYYLQNDYTAATGFTWVRTVDGLTSACCLFGSDGKWMQDTSGLYHVGTDTYLVENGIRCEEAGLVYIDGYYYYFAANAKAVKNRTYWPSKTNGLLPVGPYKFDAQGRMVNPPAAPAPEEPKPDVPVVPDPKPEDPQPEEPKPVKDGVVNVGGALYYYKNDAIQYCAGLVQLEDGSYIYVRTNGQLAIGNYWVTNNNDLLPVAMYKFGVDGKMIIEGDEPEAPVQPETPVLKDGIVDVGGILYFYENGTIKYGAGLVRLEDGAYIYVRSNGMLAIGNYWVTNNNDLLPQQTYNFGADGKMVVETEEPEIPTEPKPEEPKPEDKNGVVEVNGKLYYYENNEIKYGAGLVRLEDGAYIYVRSNGQLAIGKYWITNHNNLLPEKEYVFGADGKLYL